MERFALSMKLHKRLNKTVVEYCGYFIKQVLKRGSIIQGYCHVIHTGEKLRYYWVEDEDETRYDVSFAIAKLISPEVTGLQYILTKNEPSVEVQSDPSADEMYQLYKDNPVTFWKNIRV
jgi:hypothetical protein